MCCTRDGHCAILLMCVLVGEFVIEAAGQGVVMLANMEHGRIAVTDAKKVFVFVSFECCLVSYINFIDSCLLVTVY